MKAEKRQQQILERLRAEQREWRVEELAERLHVSAITIRRDLEVLAAQRSVLRTYGGCVYAGRMARNADYHRRVATNFELKQAIGCRAAQTIQSGEAVLIDDGSTCFHVAVQLRNIADLSLYTNSMPVVTEVAGSPGLRVSLIGGEYSPSLQHLGGPSAEMFLERHQFDRVFVGTDAIDARGRCLVGNEDLARTVQVMLRQGRHKVLLADHTKCGATAGRVAYGRLSDFDEWITTRGLSRSLISKFRGLTKIVWAER